MMRHRLIEIEKEQIDIELAYLMNKEKATREQVHEMFQRWHNLEVERCSIIADRYSWALSPERRELWETIDRARGES